MKSKPFTSIATEPLSVSQPYVSRPVKGYVITALLAVSLFMACFLWADPAKAAPLIQLMTPQSGPVGTLVVIVGSGFGASQGTSTVTFNGTPVTWVSWSATSLEVQVPAGATSGGVVVTVSGKSSTGKSFTVTPSPIITGLSPTSGAVGATIVITGSNFTAGGTQTPQVVFDPELYASPISSTDASITVAVPAGAVTGDLLVSVAGGNSNSILFAVTSSDPSITSLAPGGGVVGSSITISGTNFGTSQGTSTVTFNGTTGTPTSWSATSIKVPVPTGATTGNVVVTVGGVASNPYGFEVGTAAPSITSISPTSGAVATAVTITGTGFGSTQGASTVNFNGVSGVPTSWSATQIKVPVPNGATTGSVVVTATGTTSNGLNFTVSGTGPSVSNISPLAGPVGTSVTLTGTNFDATQGTSTLTFNGIAAMATGWSPTSIVATVPAGATSGSVVVSVDGAASSGIGFTVAPSITSLFPASGPLGTSVTISGSSFGSSQGTSAVTFNGATATPTSWSATSIVVPVPSGATSGNVVVSVNGVASAGSNFTVPTLTSISVTPFVDSVSIGSTVQFVVMGTYSDGSNANVGSTATWSSSVPSVATVNPNGVASGVSIGQATIQATIGSLSASATMGVVGQAFTGSLPTAMGGNTLTVLEDTTVLVTGGYDSNGTSLNTAEIYNSASGTFAAITNLNTARALQSATLLNNGTVLIVGGLTNGSALASAEIYNPATGTFTLTGNLNTARSGHTATILPSGQVLIAGGADANGNSLSSAELYSPTAGTFMLTGALNTARQADTATLLGNGMVLIAGGIDSNSNILQSAELYNPSTGTFLPTANMTVSRAAFTATLLNNGLVLLTGGIGSSQNSQANADLYNPTAGTFAATGSLNSPRSFFTATLLNNATVLVAGGLDASGNVLGSAELYDPVAATFSFTSSFVTARYTDTAALLYNGNVLEAGGLDSNFDRLASAELYQPSSLTPPGLVCIAVTSGGSSASCGGGGGSVDPSVNLAGSLQLTAIGTFSNNSSQTLASATWSSSNATVATITNDATNQGVAYGASPGSATATACAGSICGSTTLSIVAPPTLVSITVNPPNPSLFVNLNLQFSATAMYSDGSTNDVTSSATWTSSTPSVAMISSTGLATGLTLGQAVIGATIGSLNGSATVTVAPYPLMSLVVSPAIPGSLVGDTQQFTAVGTYEDGSTQILTSSVQWTSSNSNVATIGSTGLATCISNGNVTITASLGGLSTSVSFFVSASANPPAISATVFPAPNSSGWNDSPVVVSFTCAAGSASVVSCPAPQTVSSEGANQAVSGTVTDAVGNTALASVTLNIELSSPTITITSPADQSSVSSSGLTVTGTVASSLTVVSSVSCNGSPASFGSGAFSCGISLNPGNNLVMVTAPDAAGNIAGSRLHVTYATALPAPTSLQITPVSANVLVGSTQQFTAVDQSGTPRSDAVWTVDSTNIATISTASSPILTGVAAGVVTLTASVAGVSAEAQVNILVGTALPVGTPIWSVPLSSESAGQIVVQAVPTVNATPGLYDFAGVYNGLQAFTSDGQMLWQLTPPGDAAMGDNNGGLLVFNPLENDYDLGYPPVVADIDGQTGSQAWQSDFNLGTSPSPVGMAVGPNGTVYVTTDGWAGVPSALYRVDPNSGHATPLNFFPSGTFFYNSLSGPVSGATQAVLGPPSVGPDGSVAVEYAVSDQVNSSYSQSLHLFTMGPGGNISDNQFSSLHLDCNSVCEGSQVWGLESVGLPIPDGQGGYLAPLLVATAAGNSCEAANLVSQAWDSTSAVMSVLSSLPNFCFNYSPSAPIAMLGENGNAVATNGVSVVAFDQFTGTTQWSYTPTNGVNQVWPAEGGGFEVLDGSSNLIPLDPSGNVGNSVNCPGAASPMALTNWAATPSVSSGSPSLSVLACQGFEIGASAWQGTHGNAAKQNASPKLNVVTFMPRAPGYFANEPNWGTVGTAEQYLNTSVSQKTVNNTFYDSGTTRPATVANFLNLNGQNNVTYDVVGFIGDSNVISCGGAVQNQNCPFSNGLQFVDTYIIRTPNCDNPALGYCYNLDTVDFQVSASEFCMPQPAAGYFLANNGGCWRIAPPCASTAVQIGSYCFVFLPGQSGQPPVLTDSLSSSARIVFIGACQVTNIFTSWWNLNLNQNGTRALVVPNLTAMASAAQNQGNQNMGTVDLAQADVGYQALLNALATGSKLSDAVNAANSAIQNWYSPNNYTSINQPVLPMVIYQAIGNPSLCIRSCKNAN